MGTPNPLKTYLQLREVSPGFLEWLSEWGNPSNFDDTVSNTVLNQALIMSTKWGHLSVTQLLVQKESVDVNAKLEGSGWTGLHFAAANGQVAIAELLVMSGADVNAKLEGEGWTPLHFAAINEEVTIAELLLLSGADANAKGGRMEVTALHIAALLNQVAMAELLRRFGADVRAKTKYGGTPLHVATIAQRMDMVEWLASNGADGNAEAAAVPTPMVIALESSRMDMVKAIWNAAYSKLEDLEKDTNNPVLSKLKDVFADMELHLADTVFEYIRPVNFKDIEVANEDRDSAIELLKSDYRDLHGYTKILEKAKEQQLQGSTKGKLQKPLHTSEPPAKRAKKSDVMYP